MRESIAARLYDVMRAVAVCVFERLLLVSGSKVICEVYSAKGFWWDERHAEGVFFFSLNMRI